MIIQGFTGKKNPVPLALYQLNFRERTTDRKANREVTALCTEVKRNNKVFALPNMLSKDLMFTSLGGLVRGLDGFNSWQNIL